MALGQTDSGRYLSILFIYKRTKEALILSARDMADKERRQYEKNKTKTLPRSKSVKELVDFFETQDVGDYLEKMPEAHFDVNIKRRRHLVALEEDIVDKLTEIAKSKKVSSESLINAWLKDKIRRVTKIQKVA